MLYKSRSTSMMNVSAVHNENFGIWLDHSTNTNMMTVSAAHNENDGIWLDSSTHTSMMTVSAAHNEGILLDSSMPYFMGGAWERECGYCCILGLASFAGLQRTAWGEGPP